MDSAELRLLTSLEDRHWWYRERRAILKRELRRLPGPGLALDIGAAGGGNTRVLKAHGWQAAALEYSDSAVEVARSRGIPVIRADARDLPVRSGTCGLVIAFDVLEHIDEDYRAAAEMARVLQPGGAALIAVPCDMALWSAHDDAVGHVRRYSRPGLASVIEKAGLTIERLWSWNVLLRPAVALRRQSSTGSDLGEVSPPVNGLLTAVVVAERYLPVKSWPGVSLMVRARRPLGAQRTLVSLAVPGHGQARSGGSRLGSLSLLVFSRQSRGSHEEDAQRVAGAATSLRSCGHGIPSGRGEVLHRCAGIQRGRVDGGAGQAAARDHGQT